EFSPLAAFLHGDVCHGEALARFYEERSFRRCGRLRPTEPEIRRGGAVTQTNVSATESASSFPRGVRTKFPSTSRSKPSSSNSRHSLGQGFNSADGTPRRVRRESAILSPRFISSVSN